MPGACVEYTIEVTNAADASSSATNVAISDTVSNNLSIDAVTNITYSGTNEGDATTTTQPDGNPTVEALIATLPAGVTATFRIRATVD
ncbi:hypothetical protein [Roseinatronobacter monicus]|uniref:hypothetical protein n=1 Tax=Roseinatronobacter monicus TaxID=393481 RepID=UPI003F303EF9